MEELASSSRTLVLFTRSPEAEARVKGLPFAPGARLFARFLESWEAAARAVGATLSVAAPPSSVTALGRLFGSARTTVESQRGRSFGARVQDAVRRAFARGAAPLLVVAGDTPAPRPEILEEAFASLEKAGQRIVLEPSADGGVNLIGLARPAPGLFEGVAWGSGHIGANLRARAEGLGLAVRELPERLDVDHLDDVDDARRLAHTSPDWSRLWEALERLLHRETPVPDCAVPLPAAPCRSSTTPRAPPHPGSLPFPVAGR